MVPSDAPYLANVNVTSTQSPVRTGPAPGRIRDETAGARDEAAQKRDDLTTRRDRDADLAERSCLEHEDGDGGAGDMPMPQVLELHARALADHKRAAGDRVLAKHDREFGQRDRADSKRDRERDGRSLAGADAADLAAASDDPDAHLHARTAVPGAAAWTSASPGRGDPRRAATECAV